MCCFRHFFFLIEEEIKNAVTIYFKVLLKVFTTLEKLIEYKHEID